MNNDNVFSLTTSSDMVERHDAYYTIAARERAEIDKIKGSRFIASVAPVSSKDDAMSFVESLRKEFYDSRHNCFAYRLGAQGLYFRAFDDGEPSGSAGKPILFALQKYDVSDVALVVTRYFGGVKLGVGGLARAYSQAAENVLSICTKATIYQTHQVRVLCVYEDVSLVKRLLEKYATEYKEEYRDVVEFIADIQISQAEEFIALVQNSTNARAGAFLL
jgi:uncharacterized YigZ family protein